MPIIGIQRLPRLSAAQAAVVGATRALETAYPIILDEATSSRLGRALAALFEADAIASQQIAAEAA